MHNKIFHDFDLSGFWEDSENARDSYIEDAPTDIMIAAIEKELGYNLPAAYIELMRSQNGGVPKNTCFPTTESTSYAPDHIGISGILSIGKNKNYSLCGLFGSQFWVTTWEYPQDGIYICNCPSGGHEMILLDYTKCDSQGEPEVVHVDQEMEYKKTFLAQNFEQFIRGLVSSKVYDKSAERLANHLEMLHTKPFGEVLQGYFLKDQSLQFESILRNLLITLTQQKGFFALHSDELSYLAYDIQFYFLSINKTITSREDFVKEYPKMIAINPNGISTHGYGDFFSAWFDTRRKVKQIIETQNAGYRFSEDYKKELFTRLKAFQ